MKKLFLIITFGVLCQAVFAQKDVITLGVQFKPIIPFQNFGMEDVVGFKDDLLVTYENTFGRNLGVVIRKGFTKNFSLEFGISFSRRNYKVILEQVGTDYKEELQMGFVGYELPVQALHYVQLTERIYLNNAAGISFDMFPSDVEGFGTNIRHFTYRYAWVRPSLLANVGAEYRSRKSGYFYIGASYHRPIKDIAVARTTFVKQGQLDNTIVNTFNGHYLTIDFRYFFHESKQIKKRKKSSKK